MSSHRSLFVAGIVGVALSSVFIFSLTLDLPARGSSTKPAEQSSASNQPTPTLPRPGLPIRLTIPTLHVDAAVEYVGLTPKGAMDVPTGPADVAWFTLGPRPGENGSAVIAGHYGWKNGNPSIFDNVKKLRKGDTVSVVDDTGVTTSFVVRESRSYDPNADASDVFGSSDGKAHLNLVTCEGVWNTISQSYPRRLVVFTDKE
jgi:LPXTG-site transpeptidase (sortase) family protein